MSKVQLKIRINCTKTLKTIEILNNKIYNNQIQNKKLEQLRDTLLPKLMNGEIDLDNIEI